MAFFLLFRALFGKRPRRRIWRKARGATITGKAYVTDGDGIRVSGYNVRLADLDAPEWDQLAKHEHERVAPKLRNVATGTPGTAAVRIPSTRRTL